MVKVLAVRGFATCNIVLSNCLAIQTWVDLVSLIWGLNPTRLRSWSTSFSGSVSLSRTLSSSASPGWSGGDLVSFKSARLLGIYCRPETVCRCCNSKSTMRERGKLVHSRLRGRIVKGIFSVGEGRGGRDRGAGMRLGLGPEAVRE